MKDPLAKGPYQILRRLAVGGMGEVLLAKSAGNEKYGFGPGLIVIKRTIPGHPNRPHQNRMLKEEGRIALRLRHGNLVETFSLEDLEGDPILVMEYLAGRSMAQVLGAAKRSGKMVPVDVAVSILRNAACGLHFAHTLTDTEGKPLGLVHRDVSPANIFVTFDGRVKVIDFGVAKADDSEIKTSTGVLKGKIGYMSPEHTLGEDLTPASDLWSLGVLFWEMLVADRLFSTQNPAVTLHRINHGAIALPSSRRPEVPDGLDKLCMKLLARPKDERISSGAELVEMIDAVTEIDWRAADLGGFLKDRFPQEAEQGEQEVKDAAKARGEPVPQGLVEGRASEEADLEAATVVANQADLIELARAAKAEAIAKEAAVKESSGKNTLALAPDDDIPEDEGATVVAPTFIPPEGPKVEAALADDDEGATMVYNPDAAIESSEAATVVARPEPSDSGDGEIKTVILGDDAFAESASSTPEGIKVITTDSPKVSSAPRSLKAGGNTRWGGNILQTRSKATKPPRQGLSIGLAAAGALLCVVGLLASGMSSRNATPEYRAYPSVSGIDVVVAPMDVPVGVTARPIAVEKARLRVRADEPQRLVRTAALLKYLDEYKVKERSLLPQSTGGQVMSLVPVLLFVFGLLLLAFAFPGIALEGSVQALWRGVLMGGALVLGLLGVWFGVIGWPGLSSLMGDGPRLEAHLLASEVVYEAKDLERFKKGLPQPSPEPAKDGEGAPSKP